MQSLQRYFAGDLPAGFVLHDAAACHLIAERHQCGGWELQPRAGIGVGLGGSGRVCLGLALSAHLHMHMSFVDCFWGEPHQ